MLGIFSSLRKKPQQQAPQMSYANQSNPYSGSSGLFSSASAKPTTVARPAGKLPFDLSPPKTAGASAQLRAPQLPSAPKATPYQKITASSGMGSQHAINNTMTPEEIARRGQNVNMAAASRAKTPPAAVTATGAPRPGGGTNVTMADIFALNDKMATSQSQRSKEIAQKNSQVLIDNKRDSFDRLNQSLMGQMPFLQNQHEATKAELLAAAEDVRKSGVIQKDATEETYGESLRTGAQMNREENQRIANRMAGLGTYDSGSTRDQMINQSETFQSGQQKTLREKSRQIAQIEATVGEAERKAKTAVQQEVVNFQETVRKINETVYNNNADKEADIRVAQANLEGTLNDIQNSLDESKYNLEAAKMQFSMDEQKLSQAKPGYGLSESFISTGQPSNAQEDYILKQAEQTAWNIANGYMTMKDVTDPTIQSLAQQYLAENGVKASGAGGKTTETGMKFQTAGKTAQTALALLEGGQSNTGKVQNAASNIGSFFGSKAPTQTDYESNLAAARGIAINALAGANVPPSEYERIAAMIPVLTDEPQIAQQKLKSFINIMNSYGT